MNGLVRFRTRDGLYLSGSAGFDVLRVRPGPPAAAETFTFGAGTTQPPITNGGTLEVVVLGPAGPSQYRWTMVSHFVPGGGGGVDFGGPGVNSEVFVANYGPGAPGTFLNEFGATVSAGEVSISVTGRSAVWFLQVDPDSVVRAVGTAPFLNNTAFIFELGPFCAVVTGHVRDATSMLPIAGARVVTDGGFASTTDATGRFELADAAGATCVPEGAHVLTATEERHRTGNRVITVPGAGTFDTVIELQCTVVEGVVVESINGADQPVPLIEVTLTYPDGTG